MYPIGVRQHGSITNAQFYRMCRIILHFENPAAQWRIYHLRDNGATGSVLNSNNNTLQQGNYIVLGSGKATIC